jgi:cell division inhibitor SepF
VSMMDKLKNFIGMPEDDDYEEDIQEDLAMQRGESAEIAREPRDTRVSDTATILGHNNKVVKIAATTQLQVVLVKPEDFTEASAIADHLNEKRTVVLNLEQANKAVSCRLIDFLSGVAYANEGKIQRVAASTYIITPYNVAFMGDIMDELENNGLYF